MDWFDAYLDGLADHTNVVYPPDSHTWRPVKPTKQQQSLIQDSLIGDMVRMRLIQEARQAEIDQGMGGSYDAGSAAKEGPVAPSITVPGAPTITSIGTGNTELSAFFTAPISNGGAAITNYKYSINQGISFTVRSPASTSSPIRITGLTNGTEYDVRIRAVNSAGDGTISNALSGTPAAPGIPVAGTNSIIVNGETYTKGYGISYEIYRGELGDEYFGCTNDCGSSSVQDAIVYRDGSWKFDRNWLNNGFFGGYSYISSTNPSTNPNFIPTSGWSPSITITAV